MPLLPYRASSLWEPFEAAEGEREAVSQAFGAKFMIAIL
jgi:hypothetical protein